MKNFILTVIGITLLGLSVSAQQEPHFTMFMFNRQNINPGYTGSTGATDFQFLTRKQWVQIEGAPTTYAASLSTPIGKGSTIPKSAVGLTFYSDEIGKVKQNYVALQYAYRAMLSEKTVLSMGVQANVLNFDQNLDALNPHDPGDQTLMGGATSSYSGNVGVGLYLFNERSYAGLSVPNILPSKFNKDMEETATRHFYGSAGHVFNLTSSLKLRPAVLLKYVADGEHVSALSTDLNVSAIWNDRFLLGVSHRIKESVGVMAKIMLNDKFFLGYAYDYGVSGVADISNGSHEILLGLRWGIRTNTINSPRFINYF